MVQWFKLFLLRLFRRNKPIELLYSTKKLQDANAEIFKLLGHFRKEEGFVLLENYVLNAYNLSVLDLSRAKTNEELLYYRGRMSAILDVYHGIDQSKWIVKEQKKKDKKDKPIGTFNTKKRRASRMVPMSD